MYITHDVLNGDYIAERLRFPVTVKCFDCVTSTSTMLKELVREKECKTTLFVADSQTAGRGRTGRSFFSPKGSGVYFSLLIAQSSYTAAVGDATMYAAVAAVRAIKSTFGKDAGIKWVNDVYIGDKKCVGILTERVFGRDNIPYLIIGIGTNVYFPDGGFGDLSKIACAVTDKKNENGRNDYVIDLLNRFYALQSEPRESIINEYASLSILIGRTVEVIATGGSYHAVCKRILSDGNLVVERADGSEQVLNSGEVRLKLK